MSITYNITTNFGAKDTLPKGDSNKVIRGSEFTTEFNSIKTAFTLAAPAASPTFTGTVSAAAITATGAVTVDDLTVNGLVNEQEYNLTGTVIDPANGTIQYKTLSGNTTFTESLSNGDYVTLMIDDGSAYTITWPTITWLTRDGNAPALQTTGYTVIELFQVASTLYGAVVNAA